MNREGFLNKPFQVFLVFFYLTLCLGTLILEINDNIYNAFLFCLFFLLALYGQNRTLNYKYLTGGGEKIWDKHARKGLFFSGKNFEIIVNDDFYNERYKSVKNLSLDSIRRFFSYLIIGCYFLVLFFSGQLSHSFINIVPFLVCLTILKVTYLGHYLIPLLINILGVSYAYVQYGIDLDFFTILYIFLLFALLILYRKVEQQQILYDSDYFKKSLPWDHREKRTIVKLALQYTFFFTLLLLIVIHFIPHQWGNSEERVSEYTQIKTQRMSKWVLKYIPRPDWLKKDKSDTGAPIKEFNKGAGEKISDGSENKEGPQGKALDFKDQDGRLFNLADEKGKENNTGLNLTQKPNSPNEGNSLPQGARLDDDGEKHPEDNKSPNEISASPNNQDNSTQTSTKQPDSQEGQGSGQAPPSDDQTPPKTPTPSTSGNGDNNKAQGPEKNPTNTGKNNDVKSSPPEEAKPNKDNKDSKNPPPKGAQTSTNKKEGPGNLGKSDYQGSKEGGQGSKGGGGQGGTGTSGGSNQGDKNSEPQKEKESDKDNNNQKQKDQQSTDKDPKSDQSPPSDKNDNKDQNKDQNQDQDKDKDKDKNQPNKDDQKDDKNPGDQSNKQDKEEEEENPMLPWWLILLIVLVLAALGYLLYRWRKKIRQVDFASPLKDDLRQDFDQIQKMKLTPEQEVIVRYNFFQKVSNHLLPHESIKLPPSLYGNLVTNQFTKIRKPVEFITTVFSDVHYGEYPVSPEILKQYRDQMKIIFEFFRF